MVEKLAIHGGPKAIPDKKRLDFEFPGGNWIDEEEVKAVSKVLKARSPFRYYGPNLLSECEKFEDSAKGFYGVSYAVGVNSGTGALTSAMASLGIGPGDEVIVPGFMWIATVGAVVSLGAIPVICEVDDSLTMDTEDLKKKITKRTGLIVPVHIAGVGCDMDAIMAIANKHGISVLEDVAQANGGEYKGKRLGSIGNIGIFSFQLNKNMTTGEGGLVITNNEDLYNKVFACHDMGFARIKGRLAIDRDEYVLWGQGRRMNELQGAMARVQLKKLPKIIKKMRKSKDKIKEVIREISGISFRRIPEGVLDTGPFLVIYLPTPDKARFFTDALNAEGVQGTFHLENYGMHCYFNMVNLVKKKSISKSGFPWTSVENTESIYSYNKGVLPKTDNLLAKGVLTPIPSTLTEEQEDLIIKAYKKIAEAIKL